MRRLDRALSQDEGLKIIDKCNFATISCDDNGKIFSVPISVARFGMSVFIHGASGGKKSDLLQNGKAVCIVCVIDAKVPKFSDDEVQNMMKNKKASSVFTTEYKSVIAHAKAYEVTDEKTKIHALKILCEKYTPKYMQAFDNAIAQSLSHTKIYELKISDLSTKAKII